MNGRADVNKKKPSDNFSAIRSPDIITLPDIHPDFSSARRRQNPLPFQPESNPLGPTYLNCSCLSSEGRPASCSSVLPAGETT